MKIAVVDDLKADTKRLGRILSEYSVRQELDADIDTFANAEDFLVGFVPRLYNIIFLDIYMAGITGIEAARIIREKGDDSIIIFLTSSEDHLMEAFDIHAYGYLIKPADYDELLEKVFKIMDDIVRRIPPHEPKLSFSHNRDSYSIPYSDIICLRSDGHNTEITDSSLEVYRPRLSFSAITDKLLSDRRFLLINRGILVNMDHIDSFEDKICILKDGTSLPVNVRKSRQLDDIYRAYIQSKGSTATYIHDRIL